MSRDVTGKQCCTGPSSAFTRPEIPLGVAVIAIGLALALPRFQQVFGMPLDQAARIYALWAAPGLLAFLVSRFSRFPEGVRDVALVVAQLVAAPTVVAMGYLLTRLIRG